MHAKKNLRCTSTSKETELQEDGKPGGKTRVIEIYMWD